MTDDRLVKFKNVWDDLDKSDYKELDCDLIYIQLKNWLKTGKGKNKIYKDWPRFCSNNLSRALEKHRGDSKPKTRYDKFCLPFKALYLRLKGSYDINQTELFNVFLKNYYDLSGAIKEDDFETFFRQFESKFPDDIKEYKRAVHGFATRNEPKNTGQQRVEKKSGEDDWRYIALQREMLKCWQLLSFEKGRKILAMYHIGGCRRLKIQPLKFFTKLINGYTEDTDFDNDMVQDLLKKAMELFKKRSDFPKISQIRIEMGRLK